MQCSNSYKLAIGTSTQSLEGIGKVAMSNSDEGLETLLILKIVFGIETRAVRLPGFSYVTESINNAVLCKERDQARIVQL